MLRQLGSLVLANVLVGGSASPRPQADSYVLRFHPTVGKSYQYKVRMTFELAPQITIVVDFKSAMQATGYANGACTLKTGFSEAKTGGFPDDPHAQDTAKLMTESIDGFRAVETVAATGKVLATKLTGRTDGPFKDGMGGMAGQMFVATAVTVGSSWTTKFVDDGKPKEVHVKLLKVGDEAGSKVATLERVTKPDAHGATETDVVTVDIASGVIRSLKGTQTDQRGKGTLTVELVDK